MFQVLHRTRLIWAFALLCALSIVQNIVTDVQ